jgi:hypothetical protein
VPAEDRGQGGEPTDAVEAVGVVGEKDTVLLAPPDHLVKGVGSVEEGVASMGAVYR